MSVFCLNCNQTSLESLETLSSTFDHITVPLMCYERVQAHQAKPLSGPLFVVILDISQSRAGSIIAKAGSVL